MGKSKSLHKGMSSKAASATDRSTKMSFAGSGKVNQDAKRTAVGKKAPTIGPRRA
jgi:hypothetical protein